VGAREWGRCHPRRRLRGLRGGGVHEFHYCNPSGLASIAGNCCCIDLGKKRVAVLHARKSVKGHKENVRVFDKSLVMMLLVNLVSYDVGSSSSQNLSSRRFPLKNQAHISPPLSVCFTRLNFLKLSI